MAQFEEALKFIDPKTFERLCFDLLAAKYPLAGVTRVQGDGGDKGIDSFAGNLLDGPAIWQCKYFREIGSAQKKKIVESLRTAVRFHKPSRWILCIPVALTLKNREWFIKLQANYQRERINIDLYEGSSIAFDLIHYDSITRVYFPNLLSSVNELRSLMLGQHTPEGNSAAAKVHVDALKEHYRRLDSRFDYEIVYGTADHGEVDIRSRKGLIASMRDHEKTVNVFARDISALQLDPPGTKLRIKPEARAKYDEMLRKGGEYKFTSEEVETVESTFFKIWPQLASAKQDVTIGPTPEFKTLRRKYRLAVTGAQPNEILEYVPFRFVRRGFEEVELESCADNLGLKIGITVLNFGKHGSLNIKTDFIGRSFAQVQRAIDFLESLGDGRSLEIRDLEVSESLWQVPIEKHIESGRFDLLRSICRKAMLVSQFFNADLKMPLQFDHDDLAALEYFHDAAVEKTAIIGMTGATANLVKTANIFDLEKFGALFMLEIEVQSYTPPFKLFGQEIKMGSGVLIAQDFPIFEKEVFNREFTRAGIGEALPLRFGEPRSAMLYLGRKASPGRLKVAVSSS
jgi:hypothetical protein